MNMDSTVSREQCDMPETEDLHGRTEAENETLTP